MAIPQPSPNQLQAALFFLRIGIGILTIGHGWPKIMGGVETWRSLGAAMQSLGIYFLPIAWGFLAAITEFCGGILFTIGLQTRTISFFLAAMMAIATIFHLQKGDPFSTYSFPLSMIIVFITFFLIGGGTFSVDNYV